MAPSGGLLPGAIMHGALFPDASHRIGIPEKKLKIRIIIETKQFKINTEYVSQQTATIRAEMSSLGVKLVGRTHARLKLA